MRWAVEWTPQRTDKDGTVLYKKPRRKTFLTERGARNFAAKLPSGTRATVANVKQQRRWL